MSWLTFANAHLTDGEAVAIITVAAVDGSVPREAGTKMAVSLDGQAGSIGGGVLEYEAVNRARALLSARSGRKRRCERFALGPALGQCCGGAVLLLVERFEQRDVGRLKPWIDAEKGEPGGFVATPLDSDQDAACFEDAATLAVWIGRELEVPSPGGCVVALHADGSQVLIERPARPVTPVWLFGAGHVGAAIVQALAPLPFHVTWIDSRADHLPNGMLDSVNTIHSDTPADIVDRALRGSVVLIMTHSHAMDLDICARALERDDLAWVGLIGSATKRASFLRRLRERGLTETELGRLICPVGLPSIKGKEPAVIAASVVAQLLANREQSGTVKQDDHDVLDPKTGALA